MAFIFLHTIAYFCKKPHKMKKKGNVTGYAAARMADLVRAYKECTVSASHIVINNVCRNMAEMPSKRFWVSPTRASVVVSLLLRGNDALRLMHPLRREMSTDIYSRGMALRERHQTAPWRKFCKRAVRQPAPKFYLTPKSIKVMLCKHKRSLKEQGDFFL